MILALTGTEPNYVNAIGQSYLGPGIADTTITHLSFPSGVRAHVYVSWLHPFKEQKLVVIGDQGMALFDDMQNWSEKLLLYPHIVKQEGKISIAQRANARAIAVEPCEPLREECKHFLDCVVRGIPPRTEAEEGLRVLRVLTTAQQSLTDAL
jgi:predicted dehydrogenase